VVIGGRRAGTVKAEISRADLRAVTSGVIERRRPRFFTVRRPPITGAMRDG
jgi:hypothetical protein